MAFYNKKKLSLAEQFANWGHEHSIWGRAPQTRASMREAMFGDASNQRSMQEHVSNTFAPTPRVSLRDISTVVERHRPSGLAQQTGFNYSPGYMSYNIEPKTPNLVPDLVTNVEVETGYSDYYEIDLDRELSPPVSSESIEGGSNRPDLVEQAIQEDIAKDQRLALSSSFNTFPDDFLIINDVFLYKVPTAAISINSRSDVFVGETLRTKSPIISTEGRQDFVLNLILVFNPGKEQTENLRRIVSELSRHPLVFIFNNKIRKSIGVSEFETTMFMLEMGSLRNSSESVGAIVLDLQLHYFNHRPFSNNFFFNAKMPGLTYSNNEENNSILDQSIKLDDLEGYEASDYLLDIKAKEVQQNIRNNVIQINDKKKRNVPVNFPSESDSWMYYADYLEGLTPSIQEDPSDYIGFSVKLFSVKDPPDEAKQGFGTIKNTLSSKVSRPSAKSIYDATKPLPSSKSTQQQDAEATYNSDVEPAALEGTPINFYSYDSGRPDSIILTSAPGVVHRDASKRLSDLINVGKDRGATPIQNGLILHLQRIANRFPGRRILINSGSRFPKNPEKFYAKPVEQRSKHATGHAMDFKVEHVSNKELFKFIRTIPNSGAGYYPNSTFCHMDYREKKAFWIDMSGPGEEERTLRGDERTAYLKEHIYGESDSIEAEADKLDQKEKRKPTKQKQDAEAAKSDEFAKEQEELYKEQTKQDPSIGHPVNDPVKRSFQARANWITKLYDEGGWIYYDDGEGKIRNLFYREESAEVSSSIESIRDTHVLKDIVCSSISVQFGHRIAPIRFLSQDSYSYQFLGAGNKSGQMVFTFSGSDGRESSDVLKRLFITARDNARSFGSIVKEAGSVQINRISYSTGEQNTILSLLNIDSIVITNIRESSLPDSVDKHQLIIEFIVQDFQDESFEKLFVTTIDSKKRITKQVLSYLTRNKYGVVPSPDIARYSPQSARPYILNQRVPSWVSVIVSKAAQLCMEIDKEMPPIDWKLEKHSSKTWKDIYAEWGADKIMLGSYSNISYSEMNDGVFVDEATGKVMSPFDIKNISKNVQNMRVGFYAYEGGEKTNNIHNDLYRKFINQITAIGKEVKRYVEDEKNFNKYFGSIANDMLNAVTQNMDDCYEDLLLPYVPNTNFSVSPEFYVYDDSDENPALSSLTDPTNMKKFLKKHVENEVESIRLYMRERYLGGSYLSKNLPRILDNRRYFDEQMTTEYEFFDNFWKVYQQGTRAWEPIHYREDPAIDNNPDVIKWKTNTLSGIGASNDQEARYQYANQIVGLSNYLKKGRHWNTEWTEDESKNLVENIYSENYDKICFGPNPEYNRADSASSGKAISQLSLAQIEQITDDTFSQFSYDKNKTIDIGGKKAYLSTGEVAFGDSKAEKEAKENGFLVGAYELAKDVFSFLKEEYMATATAAAATYGGAPALQNIANARNSVQSIIRNLDHSAGDKVDSSNQGDKIASMVAGMAIGSRADDISIRRVYPTFKIYFIEEDLQDTEIVDGQIVRAFDDFYSYSAVQEIKIIRSRKIAADLAVIRMTNVGGLLLRRRFGDRDPKAGSVGERNGIFDGTNKEHPFEKMVLQDGVKVQIRLGYASNPDHLESVFLGQIVEISPAENGKILEIMCQGYGAELEAIELGELEDGPIYTSTQEALSSAIIQDSIANFGRQSKFNRFNPAEIRHAWTGGHADSILGKINPANLIRDWANQNLDRHFQKYTFKNYPQDDNIFAPPPSVYASGWKVFWNNACIYRPLMQTPWQIFKEHELRHPGYISMAVPYGHSPRMTMFFGQKMQHYWSRPPSALELYASENAYNMMIRIRGKVMSEGIDSISKTIDGIKKEFADKPELVSAMLKDMVLSSAPTKTSQFLAKETGRYKPFRNYHYFDSYHHILKNEIRTSVDGTFNEVEILYFDDEDNIQESDAANLVENIKSLGSKQEGVFAVKLDENIPESSLRSYKEEFPSCVTVDMARRYAQGIFARHLRDAYKGELIVVGKETLKPYDICYLNDASINMTGPIEVEQVIHIFNRDNGFISIITPDMCVDVNDMFSAAVFDVAASAFNACWGWGDPFIMKTGPVGIALKGIGFLGASAGVKIGMWTQDGDPVVPTPLTLGGKPFISVSLGPNQSSLFLNFHGKWVQYWDDLEDAWHKFDIAEELFDARVDFKTKVLSMLGTGAGS